MWCIVHVLHRKLMMQQRVVQQPAFLISTTQILLMLLSYCPSLCLCEISLLGC